MESKSSKEVRVEKLVFLQVEECYKPGLLEVLSKFNNSDYHFYILPLDANVVSREYLKQLLDSGDATTLAEKVLKDAKLPHASK
jgi:hypothetical protein